ncbi:hypothetical protein [Bosea sp. ANAM02]|uniref:hypothetical protein n=1 Tax=Bosea sp. ANAM02 TaxID=2020412 RepID=UPI001563226C|nr:hypothetical protein [Bosea sp. ANAM02]
MTIDPAPRPKAPTAECELSALLRELEGASASMPEDLANRAIETIRALAAERDEADRRAGASERQKAHLEEGERRANSWLMQAKEDAGYDNNVSFDQVWEETLAKARGARAEQ